MIYNITNMTVLKKWLWIIYYDYFIVLQFSPVFKAYQRTNQNGKRRKQTASFLVFATQNLMAHITHKYNTWHNTAHHRHTARAHTLVQAANRPVHHSAQLASSCKSTALFLQSLPPYPPSISLYSYCAKGHCLLLLHPPITPPLPPLPLICNLSDLVWGEIARNPANLHRPQGSVSIGPQRAHRALQACMKPHAHTVMHDNI